MTTCLPHCQTPQLKQQGPHLQVTLNRPESRNALTGEMVCELLAVIDAIADDCDVRIKKSELLIAQKREVKLMDALHGHLSRHA